MLEVRRFVLLAFLIGLTHSANANLRPLILDSERVLIESVIARLEQAVRLSRDALAGDLPTHERRKAQAEIRRHEPQARRLRGQLKRWYQTEPRIHFDDLMLKAPNHYGKALATNHAIVGELLEFSGGLDLRPEFRPVMSVSASGCLTVSQSKPARLRSR